MDNPALTSESTVIVQPVDDNKLLKPPTSLRLFYTDMTGQEVEVSVLQPAFYECQRHTDGAFVRLHKSQIHEKKGTA